MNEPLAAHPSPPDAEYAYLLGMYLGDGSITRMRATYRLRITLDEKYPGIIETCCRAAAAVLPKNVVAVIDRGDGAVDVSVSSKSLPELLPQHGRGPKHARPIVLARWQRDVVRREPRWFVKGLFDSDGCYFLNRVQSTAGRWYVYERYTFSNRSDDIRELFVWACELIGVESRRMNRMNVSVAKRGSVAILNEFLGPKR